MSRSKVELEEDYICAEFELSSQQKHLLVIKIKHVETTIKGAQLVDTLKSAYYVNQSLLLHLVVS